MTRTGTVNRRMFLSGMGGAVVLGFGAAGCGGGDSGGDGGFEGEAAVAHLESIVAAAPFLIASELGYFEREGLRLELVSFPGGTDTIRGITSGIPFGMPATLPALIAHQAGQGDLRMISGFVNEALVTFMVPVDSPIRNLDDLEGRKIAVSQPGSITTYFADRIVREHGLEPGRNVEILNVGGPPDAWTATQQGVADVAWATSPISDRLIGEDQARVLFECRDFVPDWADNTLWTTQEFIDDSPDVLRSWLRALRQAMTTMQEDVDTAAAAYAARADLDEQVARNALEGNAAAFSLDFDMAGIEENIRAGEQLGQLDPQALDLDQVIVRDLVDGL